MRVKFVRFSDKGRVTVGIENDGQKPKLYNISQETYHGVDEPRAGVVLDGCSYEMIASDDEKYRAMKKALSLLAYADNNKATLYAKLVRAGFRRDSASEAVRRCLELGYVDEHSQLLRLVAREANQGLKGPVYIKRKLIARGYKAADIDRAIRELTELCEIDFSESFARLQEKNGVTDPEELLKLRMKNGFIEV